LRVVPSVITQCPKWGSMNDACEACYSPSSQMDR
jgi:hypothetical protein